MINNVIRANSDIDNNVVGLFAFINNMVTAIWKNKKSDEKINWFYDMVGNTPYYDENIKDTNNVWEYYFLPPSKIKFSDMDINLPTIYDTYDKFCKNNIVQLFHMEKITKKTLEEIHDDVFNTLNNKIIIKPEIEILISKIKKELGLDNQKYISVHYRGNDFPGKDHMGKKLDFNIWFNIIDKNLENDYKIFLATDSSEAINKFNEKYKNRLIFNDNVDRATSDGDDNFLNLPNDMLYIYKSLPLSKNRKQSPYECGLYAVIDSYLLSGGETLIRPYSGLSFFSIILNPKINVINIDKK